MVSTPEQDGLKRRERAQQVALFRYQLICPALGPDLSSKARGKVVRAIAARTHAGPFGGQHSYSRDTLDRWLRRYRTGGFEALAPSLRQPGSRIDTTVLELAVALKRENPGADRGPGRPDPAFLLGVFPVRVDPAAALPPTRADGTSDRAGTRVRPVRGRRTERTLGR